MKKRHSLASFTVGITLLSSVSPALVFADESGSSTFVSSSVATSDLTQQQALEIVKKTFLLDETYQLGNISRNEAGNSPGNGDTWSFNFSKGVDAGRASLYISIDAATGKVRNYNLYYNQGIRRRNFDEEECFSKKSRILL